MEAQEKSLGDCTLVYLEKSFGLRQVNQLDTLDTWFNGGTTQELTQAETLTLPIFQQLLTTNVTSWNEQDLSLHFIGPIFSLVNFG
jgi:hypothetical protein